jgi:hypothetical protein
VTCTTEHECDDGSQWTKKFRLSSRTVTFQSEITVNEQSARTNKFSLFTAYVITPSLACSDNIMSTCRMIKLQ